MWEALAALATDPEYAATVVGVVAVGVVLGVIEWYGLRLGTEGVVAAMVAVLAPVVVTQWLIRRRTE